MEHPVCVYELIAQKFSLIIIDDRTDVLHCCYNIIMSDITYDLFAVFSQIQAAAWTY